MTSLLLAVIYLSFVSLGLPDSSLGAAWPSMYPLLGVPMSAAGTLNTIISLGTVVSSLLSDKLTSRLGAGKVTALSVGTTAAALFGFCTSSSYWQLCLWAIPYGLGAGSVDAALNNYVALHFSSRHMSWLHCMWGVGSAVGPYVTGRVLTAGGSWNAAFCGLGAAQSVIFLLLVLSLPLWKKPSESVYAAQTDAPKAKGLRQLLAIPGAMQVLVSFFCYCAMEWSAVLWAASYLTQHVGYGEAAAATYASLLLGGMTLGRFLAGFATARFSDTALIRIGSGIAFAAMLILGLVPLPQAKLAGLFLLGLGFAPIYPSVIHSTPAHFGAQNSQALIGLQMASAYVGTCVAPPLFGFVAEKVGMGLLPWFLLVLLAGMYAMYEKLERAAG
ncbi:MAG: MFS transporter [Oscillospiraceae bacterium]|nr:MFS transporter [Oscillospiraceae bacterium]